MQVNLFNNPYFICSVIGTILSIFIFQTNRIKISLSLLFLSSILLGLFLAGLDPFINIWDEEFHALVAKNLMNHPLKPVLIEEPLFGFTNYWGHANIWLHKQPLFLWQIALSFKIFGLNELALRIPSIIMHALSIFFVFRAGKIFKSESVGYFAALLFTWAYFPLEFITGFYPTDHNDNAFLFYALGSLWALIEYNHSKKTIFLILIGLFSGGAILCKWLTGLLVYAVWAIVIFYNRKNLRLKTEALKYLLSLAICIVVFLPWQIYASSHYPSEYATSMAFNMQHIFEPLEGHGGDYFYYYNALYEQFGEGLMIPPLIIFCLGLMIYKLEDRNNGLIVLSTVIITYLFFTLVQTKMLGYVLVTFPFFILGLCYAIDLLLSKLKNLLKKPYLRKISEFLIFGVLILFIFHSSKINKHHGTKEIGRVQSRLIKIKEKELYLRIKETYSGKKALIFNCNNTIGSQNLAMFYTGFPSFNAILNNEQLEKAKNLKYEMIAIDNGKLPEHILNDTSIIKIKF